MAAIRSAGCCFDTATRVTSLGARPQPWAARAIFARTAARAAAGSEGAIISDGFWNLQRTALCLRRRSGARKALPAILFFTDPVRTPDPEAAAAGLPPGGAVVFRTFGAPDAPARARRLKALAGRRKLKLLIGADWDLARAVCADGVHLPQRLAGRARRLKAGRPRWIVTAAAHDLASARRAARSGADAVVISTVFESASPSAGRAMGPIRLAALVAKVGAPVYALGGVSNKNARRLLASGVTGIAAVSGLVRT